MGANDGAAIVLGAIRGFGGGVPKRVGIGTAQVQRLERADRPWTFTNGQAELARTHDHSRTLAAASYG